MHLKTNSRHARSGEMRGWLYCNLGKSDYQLMQPGTPSFLTTLDRKQFKHLCQDNWTLKSLCEFQYLQFYLQKSLIKERYAGGLFYRNGCPMPVLLVN